VENLARDGGFQAGVLPGAGLASIPANPARRPAGAGRSAAMFGLGSIGLALGAVSTVTSLIEAAANLNKPAATDAPAFQPTATGSEHVTIQPVARPPSQAQSAPSDSGVVVPKFDERTMAALVALQEQHRGN
jgi:hypothetical protein